MFGAITKLIIVLNSVLNLLPFNGDKTKLGVTTLIFWLAQHLFSNPDTVFQYLDPRLLALGLSATIVGAIHKALKAFVESIQPSGPSTARAPFPDRS